MAEEEDTNHVVPAETCSQPRFLYLYNKWKLCLLVYFSCVELPGWWTSRKSLLTLCDTTVHEPIETQVFCVTRCYALTKVVSVEEEGKNFDHVMIVCQADSFSMTSWIPFHYNYQQLTQRHLWHIIGCSTYLWQTTWNTDNQCWGAIGKQFWNV